MKMAMKLQRDVRILGGILARAVDVDLVEFDLLRALSSDIGVRDRLDVQMPPREAVHVVRTMRLEHIRLQQGVMRDAPQLDPVIREHVLVVLDVLADLALRRIGKPRFEARKRRIERQLIGRTRIPVRERYVARAPRLDREREADDPRLHRIGARRFRVEHDQLGALDRLDPPLERGFVENRLVVTRNRRRRLRRDRVVDRGRIGEDARVLPCGATGDLAADVDLVAIRIVAQPLP
jgi:hypothetical protein